ncbi:MAG: hypothetical protein ACJ8BF_08175, partial [Gemmatimonadales bacterium]
MASTQPPIRSARTSFLLGIVRRYGLALASVGLAWLIIHALRSYSSEDARPALLVAIAVSALYGGLGPGLLAVLLAGLIVPDAVVLIAGAVLMALCTGFRRARSAAPPVYHSASPERTASPEPDNQLERLDPTAPGFPAEVTRVTPPFAEVTTEATWRFHHEQPLDITLP